MTNTNKSGNICMIAHRGYSSKHPGNTQQAFEAAVAHGSGGIETDVRMTADGVAILCHDKSAVFADGTSLDVSGSTYAQLTEKPLRNELSDEICYLCTFRRYLEICRDNDMICFIELKGEFDESGIAELFSLAEDVYDLEKCKLQSFNFENLIKARKAFPQLGIMLTYGYGCTGYERCFEYGFDIDIDYKLASLRLVDEFHTRGLGVGMWTANTESALQLCRLMEPDYIESDVF